MVEPDVHFLAPDGGERLVHPLGGQGMAFGQRSLGEEAHVEALQGVGRQLATGHPAVEDQ